MYIGKNIIFLIFLKKVKNNDSNTRPKTYKRVLVFCSTEADLEQAKENMPFIEGYWDAFTDVGEAKKAIESGKYGVIIADYTTHNPKGRDLLMLANSLSSNIQHVCISCRKRIDVVSYNWHIDDGYFFKYKGEERDAMTAAVYSMFTEHSPIKWIHHMMGEFNRMRNRIEADHTQTVLLAGETGTGKFTLSQLSHMRSPRRDYKFIFANCKPIKQNAVRKWDANNKSHFMRILRSMTQEANGGTMFFHDIDCLDMEAQELMAEYFEKELKVNTDKSKFNGIIICTSTRDISSLNSPHICSERLIKVLRINVMNVPSLMDFHDDIEPLILDMLESYCISQDIEAKTITKDALKRMVDHVWRRNLREMFDVIKHAVYITPNKRISADAIVMNPHVDKIDTDIDKMRKVKQALREAKGVKTKAAAILEVAPKTLYAWMKDLGIPLDYK